MIPGKYEPRERQGRGLISTKTDLKIKTIIWDIEILHILLKNTLEPDNLTIVNTYPPTTTAQSVVEREEKLKEETDNEH